MLNASSSMQFSFFSSVEGDCKSPFSQENQGLFSITRKCCLPTSESAQCFIFIPSSNRSGLTPGTPENGTNKTLLFYRSSLKGSVFRYSLSEYFLRVPKHFFLSQEEIRKIGSYDSLVRRNHLLCH